MDRTERFYRIDRILGERRLVPLNDLIHELGVSRATVIRDLTYLRDRMHAPIVFDRAQRGYRLDPKGSRRHALPGLWFNPSEIRAFLAMQHLIQQIEPGLLAGQGTALERRLGSMLDDEHADLGSMIYRVRLLPYGKQRPAGRFFELSANATMGRNRMRIEYLNRQNGEVLERTISPQRLVYHRDHWYLDALCHLRNDLRSFAVDAFQSGAELADKAIDIPPERIAERFDPRYGIFTNTPEPKRWAQLKFSPYRARWVGSEQWHPEQRSLPLDNGEFLLEVPFHDPKELLPDVLRQGRHCEVLGPEELRHAIAEEAAAVSGIYRV